MLRDRGGRMLSDGDRVRLAGVMQVLDGGIADDPELVQVLVELPGGRTASVLVRADQLELLEPPTIAGEYFVNEAFAGIGHEPLAVPGGPLALLEPSYDSSRIPELRMVDDGRDEAELATSA